MQEDEVERVLKILSHLGGMREMNFRTSAGLIFNARSFELLDRHDVSRLEVPYIHSYTYNLLVYKRGWVKSTTQDLYIKLDIEYYYSVIYNGLRYNIALNKGEDSFTINGERVGEFIKICNIGIRNGELCVASSIGSLYKVPESLGIKTGYIPSIYDTVKDVKEKVEVIRNSHTVESKGGIIYLDGTPYTREELIYSTNIATITSNGIQFTSFYLLLLDFDICSLEYTDLVSGLPYTVKIDNCLLYVSSKDLKVYNGRYLFDVRRPSLPVANIRLVGFKTDKGYAFDIENSIIIVEKECILDKTGNKIGTKLSESELKTFRRRVLLGGKEC